MYNIEINNRVIARQYKNVLFGHIFDMKDRWV